MLQFCAAQLTLYQRWSLHHSWTAVSTREFMVMLITPITLKHIKGKKPKWVLCIKSTQRTAPLCHHRTDTRTQAIFSRTFHIALHVLSGTIHIQHLPPPFLLHGVHLGGQKCGELWWVHRCDQAHYHYLKLLETWSTVWILSQWSVLYSILYDCVLTPCNGLLCELFYIAA